MLLPTPSATRTFGFTSSHSDEPSTGRPSTFMLSVLVSSRKPVTFSPRAIRISATTLPCPPAPYTISGRALMPCLASATDIRRAATPRSALGETFGRPVHEPHGHAVYAASHP